MKETETLGEVTWPGVKEVNHSVSTLESVASNLSFWPVYFLCLHGTKYLVSVEICFLLALNRLSK